MVDFASTQRSTEGGVLVLVELRRSANRFVSKTTIVDLFAQVFAPIQGWAKVMVELGGSVNRCL